MRMRRYGVNRRRRLSARCRQARTPIPLGYVRTNVNVQQMQEFYDAYGLGENDGMYVAPDERLAVW